MLDKFGLIQEYGYKTGDEYGFIHFDSVNDAQAAVNFISTYSLDESNVCLQIEPCLPPKSTPLSENEDWNIFSLQMVTPCRKTEVHLAHSYRAHSLQAFK